MGNMSKKKEKQMFKEENGNSAIKKICNNYVY